LGLTAATAVAIAVTQGGITATGSTNPNGWGMAPPDPPPVGGDGGTISIVPVGRTRLMAAPDTVGFTVDLSASTFDTPAPASGTDYDRRFHELEYFWTFGDPGTWTAPERTLPAWKNRDFAYGAYVRHCYRTSGTKTVTVMVVEPSSGKVATATLPISIDDPNTVFSGDKTICIKNTADPDWGSYPAGAQLFSQDSFVNGDAACNAAIAKSNLFGSRDKVRVLFKAGWTGTFRCDISGWRNLHFGLYGGSTIATLNADEVNEVRTGGGWGQFYQTGQTDSGVTYDLKFEKLRLKGTFSDTTMRISEQAHITYGINLRTNSNTVVVDCECDGVSNFFATSNFDRLAVTHLDNNTLTNFTGIFPIFCTSNTGTAYQGSHVAITGNKVKRSVDALSEFATGPRSLARLERHDWYHIRGNDMYNSDGDQACLRLPDADLDGRPHCTIHSNVLESTGLTSFSISGNNGGRVGADLNTPTQMHMLIDGNIVIGGWASMDVVDVSGCGATIRNNLIYAPDVPYVRNPLRSLIRINNQGAASYFADWPVRIYNNTLVSPAAPGNNKGTSVKPFYFLNGASEVAASAIGVVEQNNVISLPNVAVPQIAFAPLSTDTIVTPHCAGFRPIYHEIKKTLTVAVPNGGSYTVPYDGASEYLAAGSTEHTLVWLDSVAGAFTLTFGASDVTVTNASGTPWAINAVMLLRLVNAPGHYRAKQTTHATGNVPKSAPSPSSPALTGGVAPQSLKTLPGSDRTAGVRGAWNPA